MTKDGRRKAEGVFLPALSSVVCPPSSDGAIAQLGERVLCKHEVVGSIPSGSTRRRIAGDGRDGSRGSLDESNSQLSALRRLRCCLSS